MFFKFLFFFCIQKYNINNNQINQNLDNLNTFQKIENIINNTNSGNDKRYPEQENENEYNKDIHKLQLLYKKKQILDILQDEKVSINTKLNLIKDDNIKPVNLYAGGLMNDFDFDFDCC